MQKFSFIHLFTSIRVLADGIIDWFVGYDFFLSYAHADGNTYPRTLKAQLKKGGFRIFLDEEEYKAGDDLRSMTRRRVRHSKHLVIIGRPAALSESKWVPLEVDVYLERHQNSSRGPIIIDINGALEKTLLLPQEKAAFARLIKNKEWLRITEKIEHPDADPSAKTVERLKGSFEGLRQDTKRMRILGGLVVIFFMITVWAFKERYIANQNREIAEIERDNANNRLARYFISEAKMWQENKPDLSLLLGIEALRISQLPSVQNGFREISAKGLPLIGHEGTVQSVAFDPNHNRLASGGDDGSVRVWDLSDPEATPTVLRGHQQWVVSVAFDPLWSGEGRLASAGNDGTVRIWDLNTPGLDPLVLRGHDEGLNASGNIVVNSVAFDPLGSGAGRLASAGDDGSVRIWDLNTPSAEPLVLRGDGSPANSLAFDTLGQGRGRLASTWNEGTIRVWDLNNPEDKPLELRAQNGRPDYVAFDSAGGMRIVIKGEEGTIRIWNLNTPKIKPLELPGYIGSINGAAFDSETDRLAIGGEDGAVWVWRLRNPVDKPLVLRGHEGEVTNVAFDRHAPAPGRLASTGKDGSVRVWDLSALSHEPMALPGHEHELYIPVAFDPHGTGVGRMASGGSKTVLIWNLNNPKSEPQKLQGHNRRVTSVAFDPLIANSLASADNQKVLVWDLSKPKDNQLIQELPLAVGRRIKFMTFDPNKAGHLVVVGDDGTTKIWNLKTPLVKPWEPKPKIGRNAKSVVFDPKGTGYTAFVGAGGSVRVLNLYTPNAKPLEPCDGCIIGSRSVAFDPLGLGLGRLAIGMDDGSVRIWNLNHPKEKPMELDGHDRNVVTSVAFDPLKIGRLASSGWGKVLVWDLKNENANPLIIKVDREINSLAFNPLMSAKGQLAGAETDGTVRVWTLNLKTLQNKVCNAVGRNLSLEEWEKYFGVYDLYLTCPNRPIHPDYLKRGRELAFAGNIRQATSEFDRVLKQFKSNSYEPSQLATKYAAHKEVDKGDYLARTKNIRVAETHYQSAIDLDPSWWIIPAKRAAEIASWAKILEGDRLAKNGDISAAIIIYKQALGGDTIRHIEPAVRARRFAAMGQINEGDRIAGTDIKDSMEHYKRAVDLDSSWPIVPAKRAAKITSQFKLVEGDQLARKGDIAAAITAYQQWLKGESSRRIKEDLSIRAARLAPPTQVKKGKSQVSD